MSQMWLDKLEAATSRVEREEILLRDLKELMSVDPHSKRFFLVADNVEEQLRALASRALTAL